MSRSRGGGWFNWLRRLHQWFWDWVYYVLAQIRDGLLAIWYAFTWPIRATWQWFVFGWEHRQTRDLIRGLPAIAALIGVMVLSAVVHVEARALSFNYWQSAREATFRKDFRSAEIYLQRILEVPGSDDLQARFALGEVFEKTDRSQRAQWLFHMLAPDNRRGFPPAHRKRAVSLADTITSKSTPEEIRQLRWHLSIGDEQESPTMARAWAAYYLSINQAQFAIEKLEKAVSEYPELSLLLGSLYLGRKQNERAYESFLAASEFLRKRLDQDPENTAIRVTFANTLLRLNQLDECEAVLALGLKLDPKGPYKQLLASLYTNRHDLLAAKKNVRISTLLKVLHSALGYDPNFAPAYERLVSYGEATVEGGGSLKDILNEVIAQGDEPGLAHFAMSILTFAEKDHAATKWHLERAHSLLPDMPFVANNLAWILATEEPVDLNRALALIEPAVKAFPEEPRLLDTRATVLMKLEKWDAALDDLERALQNQRDVASRVELHKKLAIVCDKLKRPGLAEMHRKLMTNPESPAPRQQPSPLLPKK